ncbi:hypothetical protein L195_g042434, partial [Trifolium pratense]
PPSASTGALPSSTPAQSLSPGQHDQVRVCCLRGTDAPVRGAHSRRLAGAILS